MIKEKHEKCARNLEIRKKSKRKIVKSLWHRSVYVLFSMAVCVRDQSDIYKKLARALIAQQIWIHPAAAAA